MRLNIFLTNRKKGSQRLLNRLGPGWAASPWRRLCQTICLLLFLVLLFYVCWPYGSAHYDQTRRSKELIDAEIFLQFDPLVGISTALAAGSLIVSLTAAGILLLICLIVPRGFCGYLCPLGTLIDLFDWAVGKRISRFRIQRNGWWIHLKYFILAGVLIAALCGVVLAGFVAAIPVVTRGLQFLLGPLQIAAFKQWHLIPPLNAGHYISIGLFFIVLLLGLLRPRFWCRYLCPTGAVFSTTNLLRLNERKVEPACIDCGRCLNACPFDAVKADFTTRPLDCTFCQTCGGVCPVTAIQFTDRRSALKSKTNLKPGLDTALHPSLSRRGFVTGTVLTMGSALGAAKLMGAATDSSETILPVRPPGSVPEKDFLRMCVRCGECFQVCPNNVLQPMGLEAGLENLWTPQVAADWSGCEPSCSNCGQVCPTGAIRALPLEEKRVCRMALAVVNERTCLPHAGQAECQLCVDDCAAVGYNAIEFRRVGVRTDQQGMPIEDSGFLAPVVLADKCVGCGLCQMRCHKINVLEKKLLEKSAVEIIPGPGNEDRLLKGSYRALRRREQQKKRLQQQKNLQQNGPADDYLPDFLK